MLIREEEKGIRLDNYVSLKKSVTRSNALKHIKLGDVLVNNKKVKAGYLLNEGDEVVISEWVEETLLEKENIDIEIVYEDEYLMVVNKPSGLVVHPGSGNKSHTLVNALLNVSSKLSDASGSDRPGIVHRIDKDTSGLLLISKTNKVHNMLADDFKNKRIKRKYISLVEGVINEDAGKVHAPIGRSTSDRKKMAVTDINSKDAITNFKVLERLNNATLIECILETGRTHQIRVHMAYIGHPVVNDPVYNKKHVINDYGQMLHAYYIGFNHPITNEFLEFSKDPEEEFNNILNNFRNS